jgi:ribosomal protein S18 acetylase RimI-like enzyme
VSLAGLYSDVLIRPAKSDDALEVARVHVRSWQAAYRGLLPDDYLDDLRAEERAQRYNFSGDPGAPITLVALKDGAIIGFATLAAASGADAISCGELSALYVDPDHFRQGVGSVLLRAACTRLAEQGIREVVLWVLAGNATAQHFYQGSGWMPDGARRTVTRWGVAVDEIRYRRKDV